MAYSFIIHLFYFLLIPFLQLHHAESQSLVTQLTSLHATTYCSNTDIPNSSFTLICYNNAITQLHINGINYNTTISTNSLFYTISTFFPNLKVLSLVSLSLNGPLPVLVNTFTSMEILNISSNNFNGQIPLELSYLKNLQTLVFDHNDFSGKIPDWVASLSSLTVLSLKNNSLDGLVPFSLSGLVSLRVLDLSFNRLSGEVPVGFKNLTNLQVLDLENNQFGPSFPVLHNRLLSLVLKANRFTYGIQGYDLRSFYQLRKLDLSSNEFNGPFPDFLFSLPSLSYLNISGNKFTGRLSTNVSCSNELVLADLSFNRFTGDLPGCMQRDGFLYKENCLFNVDRKEQHNASYCHNEALAVMINPNGNGNDSNSKSCSKVRLVVASSVVAGVVVGGFAVFGVVLVAFRSEYFGGGGAGCAATPQLRLLLEKVSPAYTIKMLTDARYISQTMKLGVQGIPAYRTYVLGELSEATNKFHTSTRLGNSSNGQLYKGQLSDGTMIVIKDFKLKKRCTNQSYTRQIELISKLRHPNLVNPIGHCFDRQSASICGVFLVFEFVPNGTLRDSLSVGQKLSWSQRLAAAIGISKGIQFLDTRITQRIFPNNLNITDVLLDQSFHVKISGYNLSLQEETKVSAGHSVARSSETLSKRFDIEENDHDHVYDLGVIMLELIFGRPITCNNDTTIAKDMLQVSLEANEVARRSIVDPFVHKECCDESLKNLMELCVRCISKDRPSIDDVLWNLEFIAQTQMNYLNNQVSIDDTSVSITQEVE